MDIDDHIASLPEPRREIVQAVHDTIRAAASGREGDWFPVGLANQKQYVSLYICAADDDGYLAEQNADRLGTVNVGKSCVRFKRLDDIDLDVVSELTRRAADLVAAGRFAM